MSGSLATKPDTGRILFLDVARIRPAPAPRPDLKPPQPGPEEVRNAARLGPDGMQPLLVRPLDTSRWPDHELLTGVAAWQIALKLGWARVPVRVVQLDEDAARAAVLLDYADRPADPVTEAEALRAMVEDGGLTKAEVARQCGLSRSEVSHRIRLLELPQEVLTLLRTGRLDRGHGRVLLRVGTRARQIALARQAAREGLSVRALEQLVAGAGRGKASRREAASRAKDPNVVRLEQRLGELLGAPVTIDFDPDTRRGRLVVRFTSYDELDGVLQRIGYREDADVW